MLGMKLFKIKSTFCLKKEGNAGHIANPKLNIYVDTRLKLIFRECGNHIRFSFLTGKEIKGVIKKGSSISLCISR